MEAYMWSIWVLLILDCLVIISINAATRKDRRQFYFYISDLSVKIAVFLKRMV